MISFVEKKRIPYQLKQSNHMSPTLPLAQAIISRHQMNLDPFLFLFEQFRAKNLRNYTTNRALHH